MTGDFLLGGDPGRLTELLGQLAAECTDGPRAQLVADLQRRWTQARVRILLVGEAKRGKSTLANAILGRDVLPTGVVPLTALETTVRLGEPERLEIHTFDGTVIDAPLDELASYVTEGGNPGNRRGVAHLTVFLSGGLPHPSVDLVDTPGLGSIHLHNTVTAESAMERMDIAVFILSADPPIGAAEQALLARVSERSARTYIVLNKIDQLDPQDRSEVEDFTQHAIADQLHVQPRDVALYSVSARLACRASAAHDSALWVDSGMAAFIDSLKGQLQRSWRSDLAASIAATARRVVAELADESRLTERARELSSRQQSDQLAAFEASLRGLSVRRRDAVAVAEAQMANWQSKLNASATKEIASATASMRRTLGTRLSGLANMPAAQLETSGWQAIGELVVHLVNLWQHDWSLILAAAAQTAAERQQQLLDEAIADVRTAAARLLGVDLTATAPQLSFPEATGFRFDIAPDVGWNESLTSAVRRRIPGKAGRSRMHRYLLTEAASLVDKHIGRSRAAFQSRLQLVVRELRDTAAHAYELRQSQLEGALRAARHSPPARPRAAVDRRHVELIGGRLDELLDSISAP